MSIIKINIFIGKSKNDDWSDREVDNVELNLSEDENFAIPIPKGKKGKQNKRGNTDQNNLN